MKRIALLLSAMTMCSTSALRAQDAATEERMNKLSGAIEDLKAANEALRKHLDALLKEVETVREQANKPTGNYASQESLKQLADVVREVDRKRVEDGEKVRTELLNLRKILLNQPALAKRTTPPPTTEIPPAEKPQNGFEYVVQKGDTFSTIVQACREQKKLKVTGEQIQKANPNLKPDKIYPGQKIFIPAPQP
jgi:LysM repeat protein